MRDPNRPLLDPIVWEEIRQLQYEIEQRNWKLITEFRIPSFIPLGNPNPPLRPEHFLKVLKSYAAELFKAEADRYEAEITNPYYSPWVARLEERIRDRVVEAVDKIQSADSDSMVLVHGVERHVMLNELRGVLWECGNAYRWKVPGADVPEHSVKAAQAALEARAGSLPAPTPATNLSSKPTERKALSDLYRKAFPGADFGRRFPCALVRSRKHALL
jgi:hypothetical protein